MGPSVGRGQSVVYTKPANISLSVNVHLASPYTSIDQYILNNCENMRQACKDASICQRINWHWLNIKSTNEIICLFIWRIFFTIVGNYQVSCSYFGDLRKKKIHIQWCAYICDTFI